MSELTLEKRQAIVAAYLRGDKAIVIQREFSVNPGDLYRVLHGAKVPLRSADPNHPASSMAVRAKKARVQEALRVMLPTGPPIVKKLLELSRAEVAYFKEQVDAKQYGPKAAWDAYIEVGIEYYDELVERLNLWIAALEA